MTERLELVDSMVMQRSLQLGFPTASIFVNSRLWGMGWVLAFAPQATRNFW